MRTPLQRWWWWDPPRGVGLECHGQPWCWGGGGAVGIQAPVGVMLVDAAASPCFPTK